VTIEIKKAEKGERSQNMDTKQLIVIIVVIMLFELNAGYQLNQIHKTLLEIKDKLK
jgi:hypothetical protein